MKISIRKKKNILRMLHAFFYIYYPLRSLAGLWHSTTILLVVTMYSTRKWWNVTYQSSESSKGHTRCYTVSSCYKVSAMYCVVRILQCRVISFSYSVVYFKFQITRSGLYIQRGKQTTSNNYKLCMLHHTLCNYFVYSLYSIIYRCC
jgi:hypothetical protein